MFGRDRSAASHGQWSAVRPSALAWFFLEADSLLFHGETGETHVLSVLPAYVLQLLQDGARSTEEICRAAADVCETANDDAWRGKISAILRNLEDLELIERETVSRA